MRVNENDWVIPDLEEVEKRECYGEPDNDPDNCLACWLADRLFATLVKLRESNAPVEVGKEVGDFYLDLFESNYGREVRRLVVKHMDLIFLHTIFERLAEGLQFIEDVGPISLN